MFVPVSVMPLHFRLNRYRFSDRGPRRFLAWLIVMSTPVFMRGCGPTFAIQNNKGRREASSGNGRSVVGANACAVTRSCSMARARPILILSDPDFLPRQGCAPLRKPDTRSVPAVLTAIDQQSPEHRVRSSTPELPISFAGRRHDSGITLTATSVADTHVRLLTLLGVFGHVPPDYFR